MRIGIIVGDPEVTDGFLKSSRPWLKHVPKEHIHGPKGPYAILKNNGDIKDKVYDQKGEYVYIYMSVYYYLIHKYGNDESSQAHHFDLITPNEITRERLMDNDINFFNFYDPIALAIASVNVDAGIKYENLLKSLPEDKLYPPLSYTNIQHDKCKYYDYLNKQKIPIIPTTCITISEWRKSKSKRDFVKQFIKKTSSFRQTFVKPVMGTSGSFTTIYPKESETNSEMIERMYKYCTQVFGKQYPKIVLQEYHPEFATQSVEVRMMFIGDQYKYSIVSESIGEGEGAAWGMAALKNEGGTYAFDSKKRDDLKKLGQKVLKKLTPLFSGLPKLATRIDVGCCLNGEKYFVNEIEYAPAFLTSWFKKRDKNMIDVDIAEQIINIAKVYALKKKSMYPMKLKITNKKPTLKPFAKYLIPQNNASLPIQTSRSSAFLPSTKIYILGCYKSLCMKNKQMYNRLLWMNKYLQDANINMKNVHLLNIFWKDDMNRKQLQNNKYLIDQNHKILRLGEIGNFLSNMNALQTFLATKDPYCIVLEDDIHVKYNFMSNIKVMIDGLSRKNIKWDLIWLHNNGYHEWSGSWKNDLQSNILTPVKFDKSIKINKHLVLSRMKTNFIGSTAAYIINRQAAITILKKAFPLMDRPTDVFMQSNIPDKQIHLSVPKAKTLMEGTFEGIFVKSDTDESLIQLDSK